MTRKRSAKHREESKERNLEIHSLEELKNWCWDEEPIELLFGKVERAKREWEATADALPQLICLVDERGRILRANRTVETWNLGRVTAVRGLELHELLHPHCTHPACLLNRLLKHARIEAGKGQPAELALRDTVLNRHLLVRVQPVQVLENMAPSMVVVVQDVSDQKRAEESLKRHAQRLEAMTEIQSAILAARSPEEIAQAALIRIRQLVHFHHARVTLYKPESREFFVLAADANGDTHLRPGRSYPDSFFLGNRDRQPDKFFVIDDLATLSDPSIVERQLLNDGIRSYVSLPLSAEGDFIGSLSLGTITPSSFDNEQIKAVSEVGDLLAIATRQARLYHQLQRANTELEKALHSKDQMIQNVSHELRTPLSIIYGYTEVLLETSDQGPLTPKQARILQAMLQQGERLRFMVERILALQTFDAQHLQLQQIQLDRWLPAMVSRWESRASRPTRSAPIRFQVECSASPILADMGLLQQVMVNLLDNAQKFSPKGGTVRISARAEDDYAILAVFDQGIGIPPEKLSHIFERFYQVDGSATRRYGGMGIGLALCRTIVEAHGGRIWAESQGEGHGSTFYVLLPKASSQEESL